MSVRNNYFTLCMAFGLLGTLVWLAITYKPPVCPAAESCAKPGRLRR